MVETQVKKIAILMTIISLASICFMYSYNKGYNDCAKFTVAEIRKLK